jgi:hypothetical protein
MSTIGAASLIDANPPPVRGVVPPQSRTTAPHALGSATTSYVSGVGVIRRAEFPLCNGAVHLRAGAAPARGRALSPWTDTCGYTAHDGFGPQLVGSAVQETGWYDTDVRALDLVLHDRVRAVRVPHRRPSLAFSVYVPFYAGLDVARHLWGYNVSARDTLALELADLLVARSEWKAVGTLVHRRAHHVGLPAAGRRRRREGDQAPSPPPYRT